MSLILKGIDLPTEDQVIVIHSDGTFNEVDPFARRLMPLYKVIQIPKGHGRIGDLDELQKAIRTDIMGGLNYGYFIRNAPTILESEESDESDIERD